MEIFSGHRHPRGERKILCSSIIFIFRMPFSLADELHTCCLPMLHCQSGDSCGGGTIQDKTAETLRDPPDAESGGLMGGLLILFSEIEQPTGLNPCECKSGGGWGYLRFSMMLHQQPVSPWKSQGTGASWTIDRSIQPRRGY